MTTQVQFRRGTTASHTSFAGAIGEVTVDTDLKTLLVHDGTTLGGTRIARYSDTLLQVVGDDSATFETRVGEDVLQFSGGNSITTSTSSSSIVTVNLDDDIIVNNISSADSTEVVINDGLRVTGTSNLPTLETNQLSSGDSTAIQINDAVNISGDVTLGATLFVDNIIGEDSSAVQISTLDVDTISSSSSTGIQINDAVNISGALSVNSIDTNEISSGDSTGVVINDELRINGNISAVDSTALVVQDALEVNGALTVAAITASGTVTHNAATVYSVQDDLATSTTALALTVTVHSLAAGESDYTLAAGTEGQIMHFVVAGGSSTANEVALTTITVSQTRNPRIGDVLATYAWQPFITGNDALGDSTIPQRTMASCIFANGAWNLDFFTKV